MVIILKNTWEVSVDDTKFTLVDHISNADYLGSE